MRKRARPQGDGLQRGAIARDVLLCVVVVRRRCAAGGQLDGLLGQWRRGGCGVLRERTLHRLADGDHVANASVQLTGATDENESNDDYTTSFATSSGADVTWTIVTDNYPGETTWSVTNDGRSHGVVRRTLRRTGTTYSETVCLPYGCYTLTVNDSYGDGICCAYGVGSFELTSGARCWLPGGSSPPRRAPISVWNRPTFPDAPIPQRSTTTLRPRWTMDLASRRWPDARIHSRATTTPLPTKKTGRASIRK